MSSTFRDLPSHSPRLLGRVRILFLVVEQSEGHHGKRRAHRVADSNAEERRRAAPTRDLPSPAKRASGKRCVQHACNQQI